MVCRSASMVADRYGRRGPGADGQGILHTPPGGAAMRGRSEVQTRPGNVFCYNLVLSEKFRMRDMPPLEIRHKRWAAAVHRCRWRGGRPSPAHGEKDRGTRAKCARPMEPR